MAQDKVHRIVISGPGGPENLKLVEETRPIPSAGQVRIAVEAAGLSWGDVMMRRGIFFRGSLSFPMTPGYDVVGRIDALGEGVSTHRVGDRVAALTIMGGYADYICVPEDWLTPVPDSVDAAEAAAVVLNYATAYQILHREAKLQQGASFLVHGGAGGVGTALLDLGRQMRAKTFGTSSAGKLDIVRSFGATALDYKNENIERRMAGLMPDGVDAVFDSRAGGALWESRRLASRRGHVVAFGITDALKDGRRDLSAVAALMFFLASTRILPGPRTSLYAIDQVIPRDRASVIEDTKVLFGLLAKGEIKPLVSERFALADAVRAHTVLENRSAVGKLVFTPLPAS